MPVIRNSCLDAYSYFIYTPRSQSFQLTNASMSIGGQTPIFVMSKNVHIVSLEGANSAVCRRRTRAAFWAESSDLEHHRCKSACSDAILPGVLNIIS